MLTKQFQKGSDIQECYNTLYEFIKVSILFFNEYKGTLIQLSEKHIEERN